MNYKVLHSTVIFGRKWLEGAVITLGEDAAKDFVTAGLLAKAKAEDGPGVQADPREPANNVNRDNADDHKTIEQLQDEGLDKPDAAEKKAAAEEKAAIEPAKPAAKAG
jgi:hypothetical protein